MDPNIYDQHIYANKLLSKQKGTYPRYEIYNNV